jgi:hypothetical protein
MALGKTGKRKEVGEKTEIITSWALEHGKEKLVTTFLNRGEL